MDSGPRAQDNAISRSLPRCNPELVEMKALPFAISSAALAIVEETLRHAEKHPEVARMIPALVFCFSSQTRNKDGRLVERITGGLFIVGWYRAAQTRGCVLLDLLGRKFAFWPHVLKRLKGKKLV